jgi:hypothetical protein
MAIIDVPPELEDLSLRERRRRFEERSNGTAELDQVACSVCSGPIEADRSKAGARTCAQESCVHEARRRRRRAARDSTSKPERGTIYHDRQFDPGNGSHPAPAQAAQETPETTVVTNGPSMPISAPNSASPGSTNNGSVTMGPIGPLIADLIPVARQYPGSRLAVRLDGIAISIRTTNGGT